MNKTSQDYRKELTEARAKIKSLESQIKDRLIKMIERFPESFVYYTEGIKFTCRQVTKAWLDNQTTDTLLICIKNIEEYNASQSPNKQFDLFE